MIGGWMFPAVSWPADNLDFAALGPGYDFWRERKDQNAPKW